MMSELNRMMVGIVARPITRDDLENIVVSCEQTKMVMTTYLRYALFSRVLMYVSTM